VYTDTRYAFKAKFLNPDATGKQRKIQVHWVLTEPGLYLIVLKSQSKVAKEFMDWLLFEVIPSIRKTGRSQLNPEDQQQLDATNAALEAKLKETETLYRQAKAELVQRIEELQQEVQARKADMDDRKLRFQVVRKELARLQVNKENIRDSEMKLAEKKAQSSEANKCMDKIRSIINASSESLACAREDLSVVTDYLTKFCSSLNVASVLCDKYSSSPVIASDPMVNRNRIVMLRCATFNILHVASFIFVRGFQECKGRIMTCQEANQAVAFVMNVSEQIVYKQARYNWISMYTVLAGIAKKRLQTNDNEIQYSTEMPISHLYLYTKRLNEWANRELQLTRCASYDQEVEAFFGSAAVAQFTFDEVDYTGIQSAMEAKQPPIAHVFGV
jgi:prophage antirepressor-like protein